jgi:hypothetical protein
MEQRWHGTSRRIYIFLWNGGMRIMNKVQVFFLHKRIISAVKRVEVVSNRMSRLILSGCWCYIILLNVYAPTEDKTDDMKDRFYEELGYVFDKFPKYHIKVLLGYFNAKVGREDIFKPTIENECLHEISNDNGVRVVNFTTWPVTGIALPLPFTNHRNTEGTAFPPKLTAPDDG